MDESTVDLENIKKQAEEGLEKVTETVREENVEKTEGVVTDIKDKLGK